MTVRVPAVAPLSLGHIWVGNVLRWCIFDFRWCSFRSRGIDDGRELDEATRKPREATVLKKVAETCKMASVDALNTTGKFG